eukprot:gene10862-3480_t
MKKGLRTVKCADKKVIQTFCNKCSKRGKYKRFFFDVTKKTAKNKNYAKLYSFVCIKNNYFASGENAHFTDAVYVYWRNVVLNAVKSTEREFLKTLSSKTNVNQKCMKYAKARGMSSSDVYIFETLYQVIEKFRGFEKLCRKDRNLKRVKRKIKNYMKRFVKPRKYYKTLRKNKDYEGYKKLRYHITMFKIVVRYILTFEQKLRKRESYCSIKEFILLNKYIEKVGKDNFQVLSGISKKFNVQKVVENLSQQRDKICSTCPFEKMKEKRKTKVTKKVEKKEKIKSEKVIDYSNFLKMRKYKRTKRMIKKYIKIAGKRLVGKKYYFETKEEFFGEKVVLEILELLD